MLHFYYFINQGLYQLAVLPIWWYSRGLSIVLSKLADWQLVEWRRLGLLTWIKNLFVPMFHDYTIIGRGLSFVMRLIIIFIRTINLLVKFLFKIVLLVLWFALPVIVVLGLVRSF
jgi:hypothetical protein